MTIAIANVDMAAAWDGDEGDDWARDWQRYDRSIQRYQAGCSLPPQSTRAIRS
jgi:hypothetical protein